MKENLKNLYVHFTWLNRFSGEKSKGCPSLDVAIDNLLSMSSTFYARIFVQKCFRTFAKTKI